MPTFNFNLSKIKCKTEVSTELTHFLTLMNNDKSFSSLDGMTCIGYVYSSISRIVAHLKILVHDVINLLCYEY